MPPEESYTSVTITDTCFIKNTHNLQFVVKLTSKLTLSQISITYFVFTTIDTYLPPTDNIIYQKRYNALPKPTLLSCRPYFCILSLSLNFGTFLL